MFNMRTGPVNPRLSEMERETDPANKSAHGRPFYLPFPSPPSPLPSLVPPCSLRTHHPGFLYAAASSLFPCSHSAVSGPYPYRIPDLIRTISVQYPYRIRTVSLHIRIL